MSDSRVPPRPAGPPTKGTAPGSTCRKPPTAGALACDELGAGRHKDPGVAVATQGITAGSPGREPVGRLVSKPHGCPAQVRRSI
jgi:hypothetical protein